MQGSFLRWPSRIFSSSKDRKRDAKRLEELYGDSAEVHAAELAHHFAEAEAILGTDKLVRYSLMAGERALSAYAYEEALAHFERGLAAEEDRPTDEETAGLLFGLARVQAATLDRHRFQEAIDTLNQAFDSYSELGDVARAVAVAEYPLPVFGQYLPGVTELMVRGLALVLPDSHEAGRLLAAYGFHLGRIQGDYEGAQDAFSRALAIAQRQGDATLEMRTLANASFLDQNFHRYKESLEKSARVTDWVSHHDMPQVELTARQPAVFALLSMGDVAGARQQATAMLAASLFATVSASQIVGDWPVTYGSSDRALSVGPMDPRPLSQRVLLDYEVGDFGQGEAHLDRMLDVMRLTPPGPRTGYTVPAFVLPMVARITGETGNLALAGKAAEIVLRSGTGTPSVIDLAKAGLAMAAALLGDVPLAAEQYTALEARRGMMLCYMPLATDRLLGLLSHTMGNLDKAAEHFEDALAFCRKAGYRPELGWACCDYADTLLQRHSATGSERTDGGDREKAMSLLDESLAISNELGMRPLMERVLCRREILGA